jgi:transposase InsO family protein
MAHLIDTERKRLDCVLNISSMCRLAQITRAQFYRQRERTLGIEPDPMFDEQVKVVALERPSYGYRRIKAELRRRGGNYSEKRVRRSMRQQNLRCKRRRRFITTTDSKHGHPIYPNLAGEINVTTINQLWVADITYVRLVRGFVYLAAILDAYSRRVIGWEVSRSLDAKVALAALSMALAARQFSAQLVHHSDQGVQYASGEYTNLLKERGVQISMSRRGTPYDNARCERFMRTLKEEEVYLSEYETMSEARESIALFIEDVYNQKRLHSALGYIPPAEFEQQLQQSTGA